MRILILLLSLSTALCAVSCKKAAKEKATGALEAKTTSGQEGGIPIRRHATVVATVQLPTGMQIEGLSKAFDNIQPGFSPMIRASIPAAVGQVLGMEISDVDLDAPIAAVVLSPKKFAKPLALLVRPTDRAALEAKAKAAGLTVVGKNGLVLIGEGSTVEAAQGMAFAELAKPPTQMVARIYPNVLMTTYKDDLHEALSAMSTLMSEQQGVAGTGFRTLMLAYEEMFLALGNQADVVEMRVGTADGASDLLFRVQPRASTTMAAFAAAQVPSSHELLGKLPQGTAGSMVFSGELRAGAARKPMIDFAMKIMGAILPTGDGVELANAMASWFEFFDGKMAMNIALDMSHPTAPKFAATYLWGTTNADAVRKGWRDMMGLMVARAVDGRLDMMGMKFDVAFDSKVLVIDGIEVDRYQSKVILDHLSDEQKALLMAAQDDQVMHMASFDDVTVMAMSGDSANTVSQSIAAARGKAAGYKPSRALSAAVARSAALGESMIVAMDMASFMPAEIPMPFRMIAMGFGQDSGALTMRMSVRK